MAAQAALKLRAAKIPARASGRKNKKRGGKR